MVFVLSGEGEDREDMWISYYKNGEMERCPAQIIFTRPTAEWARDFI